MNGNRNQKQTYFFTAQGILASVGNQELFINNNEVITYPIRTEPSSIASYSSNTIDQLVQAINPIVGQINETVIDINQDRVDLQRALDSYNKISSNYDPIHCQVSEWSGCSQPCGTGKQTRLVTQSPANGGNLCPVLDEQCNTQSCPLPVDCEVSSTWTSCSRTCNPGDGSWKNNPGRQTRQIITNPKNGGKECPETSRICNDRACPTDCALSEWSRCSKPCNNGTGAGTQTRVVATQPKNGGKFCPSIDELSRACNAHMCSVDCTVSGWSVCSKPCADSSGPGNQTRTITRPSAYGGAPCPSDMSRTCNTDACPPPVDCIYSWSPCSKPCTDGSGPGTQNLIINRQSAHGGKACPTTKTQNCNIQSCPPINCQVSGWSDCSAPCGGGSRSRSITVQPAYGGTACLPLKESCNTQGCRKDCQVGAWGNCSTSCGGGVRYREITVQPVYGGTACLPLKESCNSHLCQWQIDEQKAIEKKAAEQRAAIEAEQRAAEQRRLAEQEAIRQYWAEKQRADEQRAAEQRAADQRAADAAAAQQRAVDRQWAVAGSAPSPFNFNGRWRFEKDGYGNFYDIKNNYVYNYGTNHGLFETRGSIAKFQGNKIGHINSDSRINWNDGYVWTRA